MALYWYITAQYGRLQYRLTGSSLCSAKPNNISKIYCSVNWPIFKIRSKPSWPFLSTEKCFEYENRYKVASLMEGTNFFFTIAMQEKYISTWENKKINKKIEMSNSRTIKCLLIPFQMKHDSPKNGKLSREKYKSLVLSETIQARKMEMHSYWGRILQYISHIKFQYNNPLCCTVRLQDHWEYHYQKLEVLFILTYFLFRKVSTGWSWLLSFFWILLIKDNSAKIQSSFKDVVKYIPAVES